MNCCPGSLLTRCRSRLRRTDIPTKSLVIPGPCLRMHGPGSFCPLLSPACPIARGDKLVLIFQSFTVLSVTGRGFIYLIVSQCDTGFVPRLWLKNFNHRTKGTGREQDEKKMRYPRNARNTRNKKEKESSSYGPFAVKCQRAVPADRGSRGRDILNYGIVRGQYGLSRKSEDFPTFSI